MNTDKLNQLMENDVQIKTLMEDIVDDFVVFERSLSHTDQTISTKELLSVTGTCPEDVKFVKNDIIILKDKEFVDSVEDYLPNSTDECYCVTFDYDEWRKLMQQTFNSQLCIEYKIEPFLELSVFKKVKYFMNNPTAMLNGIPVFSKHLKFYSLDSLESFISENISNIVVYNCYKTISSEDNFILTCALL